MKHLVKILIFCALSATSMESSATNYTVSPTVTPCVDYDFFIELSKAYCKGIINATISINGSSATIKIQRCNGNALSSGVTYSLVERTYSATKDIFLPLGTEVVTKTSSSSATSFSFNCTLSHSSGTMYYTVIQSTSQSSVFNVTQEFAISVSTGGGTGICTFTDLTVSDGEEYTAACYLTQRTVLDGGTVNPNNNIIRQDLAKIAFRGLYALNGANPWSYTPPTQNYPSFFSDTYGAGAPTETKALSYLEYGDGVSPFDKRSQFYPTNTILRMDIVKVFLETFNIKPISGTDNPFTDSDSQDLLTNSPNYFGYMRSAYNWGIIKEGKPYKTCTRIEAFLMLYRIMTQIESGAIENPSVTDNDYFQPLNVTLANISMGLGIEQGNFSHYAKTDYHLDGALPLDFAHSYNSYNSELPDIFFGKVENQGTMQEDKYLYQPLGPGWSHSFHTYITFLSSDVMLVHWGGGTLHIYNKSGSTLTPFSIGVYDEATYTSSQITIKTKEQVEYKFKKRNVSGATDDGVWKLSNITDRNGNALTINYELGVYDVERISSVSDGNRSLTFWYNGPTYYENQIYKVTDPLGRDVGFRYTLNNQTGKVDRLSILYQQWEATKYYYYSSQTNPESAGLLSYIVLPKNNYLGIAYDRNHRLKSTWMVDRDGTIKNKTEVGVTTNYSSSSNPTSSEVTTYYNNGSSSGNYTNQFKFNPNNRPTQITGNSGLKIDATYSSANPALPTSINTNSDKTDIEYDSKGNIKKITQKPLSGSGNRVTTMNYNSRNDVTDVTDANGNTTYYDYDSKGNLTKIRAPENATTNITVNSKGLPTSVTNPENIVTNYAYNSYGNLQSTTIPALSITSSVSYDASSRVLSVKDFLNRQTTFTYDSHDNLLTEKDALNHTTSYVYDANDNLTSITNAKGEETTLNYDAATDWLTSVSFGGATKNYAYNDDGTLKNFTKPDGTRLNSTYDDLRRITNDGVNSYTYDSNHRLSTITKGGKTLTYAYNGFNEIIGVTYSDFSNNTVNYTYDANGNIESIVYPGNKMVNYTYDGLNRMKTVKDWNNNTIRYNYKKDSRIESVSYPNGMTVTYSYDKAGRQTGKTVKRSNGSTIVSYYFVLDNADNITNETRTEPYSANVPLTGGTTNYSYNSANRITKAGSISFSFDANGNTKQRGSESYSYDNLDKLTSGGGYSFEYDGLGNIRNDGQKRYMIDIMGMGNVIAECNASGTPTAYYIYGADGLESRILPNGTTEYYVSDYRGNVVAMVDASNSAIVTHKYQYDDFGAVAQKQETDYNPFRYVGKHGVMYFTDNLYYMRARFYDPNIGRFLTEDPIWSTNLYPYADNNPIMRLDPEGESETLALNGIITLASNEAAIEQTKEALEVLLKDVLIYTPVAKAAYKGVVNQTKEALKGVLKLNSGIPFDGATLAGGVLKEGAMVGSFLVGYSIGNGINAASNSKNLTQFVNNMNKSGDPIYKASQWVGNKIVQGLNATFGKSTKKKSTK
jgi:RHS repeat-associated protein